MRASIPDIARAACVMGFCLGIGVTGCGGQPVEEKPFARPVKILVIGEPDRGGWREYLGTVKAAQRVDMAFEVPGRISERPVREAEIVKRGTVLARLDDRDYVARLDTAEANLRKAQADFRRGMNIFDEEPGAISRAQIDSLRRDVEVAEARFREAAKAVEDTVLRAPFDGMMARKLVYDFAAVQAMQPVLVFQDISHLEIEVNVPERDLARERRRETNEQITARLTPEVVVTAIPNRRFPARVKEFSAEADPFTRTFQGTLIFDNPRDVLILPGMTALVRLRAAALYRTTDRVTIPANSVLADTDNRAFVWLLDPDSMTVRRAAVGLGELSGAEIEIRTGLSNGDRIAVSGVHYLREGMAVREFVRQFAR